MVRSCYLCQAIERSIIDMSVVYIEILVQPRAISGWNYLEGLRIATYLCRWKEDLLRVAMPANALFLAMDNFFRQVVNFSEQSHIKKVTVACFATIVERQIALPWRLRLYLTTYISPGSRVGRTKIRPRWVEHLSHNTKFEGIAEHHWTQLIVKQMCVLDFATGSVIYANISGVRVRSRRLHRCRRPCAGVTLVAAIN